jgi:hypothetical protein
MSQTALHFLPVLPRPANTQMILRRLFVSASSESAFQHFGSALRALATILIITFAVFLIVAGYSDQQIAPAFGLLGTLAGYLLGKDATSTSARQQD